MSAVSVVQPSTRRFRNRQHAGEALAERLHARASDRPVVLAPALGAVPVAAVAAAALDAPLDVVGADGQPSGDRSPVSLVARTAIIVADGIATGTTARAAIAHARGRGAARVVLAAPVGRAESVRSLAGEVDELVCLLEPRVLWSVAFWYENFDAVTQSEVDALLARQAVS
ncbi:MAG: phosphoribosyltransferase family protein [Solirubrobacteraceae bacterium]|jgi:putative phosphoribosyl transferase